MIGLDGPWEFSQAKISPGDPRNFPGKDSSQGIWWIPGAPPGSCFRGSGGVWTLGDVGTPCPGWVFLGMRICDSPGMRALGSACSENFGILNSQQIKTFVISNPCGVRTSGSACNGNFGIHNSELIRNFGIPKSQRIENFGIPVE